LAFPFSFCPGRFPYQICGFQVVLPLGFFQDLFILRGFFFWGSACEENDMDFLLASSRRVACFFSLFSASGWLRPGYGSFFLFLFFF